MSRFDDRDQAVEPSAAFGEHDQDAPGLEIGGPAAVAQAAELMELPEPATVKAAPAVGHTQPLVQPAIQPLAPTTAVVIEAVQPTLIVAPDGGGGGGTQQRGGGAAQVHAPGPSAAVDASMQLRAAEALQQQALLEEPVARTPVALRRKKKKRPTAPVVQHAEVESDTA